MEQQTNDIIIRVLTEKITELETELGSRDLIIATVRKEFVAECETSKQLRDELKEFPASMPEA